MAKKISVVAELVNKVSPGLKTIQADAAASMGSVSASATKASTSFEKMSRQLIGIGKGVVGIYALRGAMRMAAQGSDEMRGGIDALSASFSSLLGNIAEATRLPFLLKAFGNLFKTDKQAEREVVASQKKTAGEIVDINIEMAKELADNDKRSLADRLEGLTKMRDELARRYKVSASEGIGGATEYNKGAAEISKLMKGLQREQDDAEKERDDKRRAQKLKNADADFKLAKEAMAQRKGLQEVEFEELVSETNKRFEFFKNSREVMKKWDIDEETKSLQEQADLHEQYYGLLTSMSDAFGQSLVQGMIQKTDMTKMLFKTAIGGLLSFMGAMGGPAGGFIAGMGRGILGAFQHGTSFAPGGPSLVGERGPEIVNVPRGASVVPSQDTRAMGGGGRTLHVHLSGGSAYTREQLKRDFRTLKREGYFRDFETTIMGN